MELSTIARGLGAPCVRPAMDKLTQMLRNSQRPWSRAKSGVWRAGSRRFAGGSCMGTKVVLPWPGRPGCMEESPRRQAIRHSGCKMARRAVLFGADQGAQGAVGFSPSCPCLELTGSLTEIVICFRGQTTPVIYLLARIRRYSPIVPARSLSWMRSLQMGRGIGVAGNGRAKLRVAFLCPILTLEKAGQMNRTAAGVATARGRNRI